jgi:hypothetical protein
MLIDYTDPSCSVSSSLGQFKFPSRRGHVSSPIAFCVRGTLSEFLSVYIRFVSGHYSVARFRFLFFYIVISHTLNEGTTAVRRYSDPLNFGSSNLELSFVLIFRFVFILNFIFTVAGNVSVDTRKSM